MNAPRASSSLAILLLLLSAGSAGAQIAQGDGPIVVGERKEGYKWFELDHWNATLDLLAQQRRERRRQDGIPTLTDTETLLRETLDLSGRAFIGHKNLIDVTGMVKLGLEDIFLDSDTTGLNTHEGSFANLYDLNALILQEGPAPTNIYTRRDEQLLYREFGGSLKTITTESGITTQVRSSIAPTSFAYFHREQEERDPTGFSDFGLIQDTATIHSNAQVGTHQNLNFDYNVDDIREQQSRIGANSYTRHDATLTHTVDFGPEEKHNLRSMLRVYDQGGNASQRVLRLDEQMLLKHTPRFDTRYNLVLENQELSGQDQRLARGSVTARHRLFDSLVSSATLGASRQQIPNEFIADELFAQGNLDYTKKVPKGRLDASLGAGYSRQNNGERGTIVAIPEGSYVFRDPFPLTISQRNVIPASVVVRDAAGLRTFSEGFDYTLQSFPDRIELRRIVGGAIADGQAVRIRFDVGPEPSNQIDTSTVTLSVRYTLEETWAKGLSPYFIYRYVGHQLNANDPSLFILDDVQALQFGMDYFLGDLRLKAEREIRDSTVQGYDANRFEAHFDRRLSRYSAVNASATREEIVYRDTGNRIELNRVSARISHRFAESFDVSLRLQFRDERSGFNGHLRGFEEDAEINWRKGQTTIYASVRNALLDGDVVDTFSQTFVFGFKRNF